MTEEIVRNHRKRLPEIIALSDAIKQLYDTRHSVSFAGSGAKYQTDGRSVIEKALEKIDSQRDRMANQIVQYFTEKEEIDAWLKTIPDPIMKTIVISHLMNGNTWDETGRIIYGRRGLADSTRVYYRRHKSEIFEE